MGVYLNKPKIDKNSEDGGDDELRYGLTSMQGWRRNMEDAHLAVPAMIDDPHAQVAVYGVFDGHGGAAVAAWVKKHFSAEFIRNLTEIRNRVHAGDLDVNTEIICNMERAIEKPPVVFRYPIDIHGLHDELEDEATGADQPQPGEDLNVVEEEPETFVTPSELDAQAMVVCEAMQKTFLSLDQRMTQLESRRELKEIHDALKADDEEESDVSSELQNLLQCYLDCGKNGGLVRLTDDGSGQKCLQIFNADEDGENDVQYPWTDSDAEPTVKRIEDVSGEDIAGDGHVEGTVKDTVVGDGDVASPLNEGQCQNDSDSPMLDSCDAAPPRLRKAFRPSKKGPAAADQPEASTEEDASDNKQEDPPTRLVPYEPENCGATAVVTAIIRGTSPMLIAANAGDSRVVLCRAGVAVPLSRDHKPNNSREVRRIHAAGGRVIQGRVDGNLNLSRSVGDLAYKMDQNIPPEAQKITAFPDIRLIPIHQDDEFAIIACDGIWDCLTNQQIVNIVRERLQPQNENGHKASKQLLSEICEEICDTCLASNPVASEGIGCDNMTMMIVELGSELRRHGVTKASDPKLYRGRLYRLFEQPEDKTRTNCASPDTNSQTIETS